ncbi:MAG TPA: DMT family transporter [Geminicoccus sp.]|jgi:drug/metabolite transporter (DMT)-like permease|uniref:DMT family transporter n=1 Tax=Geminicoccus sp. TaxID=2024832 RepID=UPI002E32D36B|nr:DMT family transporter [Geminicoccus sp.]HEX2527840.1 DMT family transporter [Geminicoccus sp.]
MDPSKVVPLRKDNLRAAALVIGAVAFWSVGDTLVKLLTERITIPEILFLRGLMSIVLVVAVAWLGGWRPSLRTLAHPLVLFRGLIEIAVVFAYLSGVAQLPIAIANTLVFTSPLWGVALGGLVLGERLGRARIGAVLLGFTGMLFVTDPLGTSASWWVVLPLVAALLQALGDLVTRRIDKNIPTDSITITTLVMITLGGGLASVGDLSLPGLPEFGLLAAGAVLLVGAYLCYIRAFRIGEMSFAAPFKYVSIPLTMLSGWLVWGDRPTMWMLFGALLIVMAGILIVWQDRPRQD